MAGPKTYYYLVKSYRIGDTVRQKTIRRLTDSEANEPEFINEFLANNPGYRRGGAKAIIPAANNALKHAGITITDISAIKTHNPFAVNDIYFCQEMDIDWKDMNNNGCSLIYGHAQGPTGARLIIELIEELVQKGGGYGMFDGCAAGDTGAAIILKVKVE